MSDAIFLCDPSQIPAALRLQHRLGRGAFLATGDMTTAWELERLGVPFLDEHDVITGEERLANWEAAGRVAARGWGEHAVGDADGLPLLDAARGELRLPVELCLDAVTVYRRLLADHAVRHAHVFFLPPAAICRTQPAPGIWAATSLSQAVLRREAEHAGVSVVPVRSFRPLAPEGPRTTGPPARPAPAQTAVARGGGERTALLLDTGLRAAETALLERRLAAEPGWRVARLAPWELAAGGPLDRPWLAGDAAGDLARLERAIAAGRTGAGREPADVLDNPHLRFQLARIVAELQSAARIGEAFGALLQRVRPALCVLGHDAFAVERTLVRVARRHGVPTAALIHGGFRPRRIYRDVTGEADRLLVWGPEDAEALTAAGVQPERIRVVGSILYDERYRRSPAPPGAAETARARAELGVPVDRPLVLALTATITKGLAAAARPTLQRSCWRELSALAARRPDLTFAIKPHPSYDHFELYRRLARGGPANFLFLEDVPLATALAAAAATVLINSTTTAAMEGLLLGVPVVFWQAGLYSGNSDDPLAAGGAEIVGSLGELESALDRLLRDGAARAAAVAAGARATARILGDPVPPAIERLVAELTAASRLGTGNPRLQPVDASAAAAAVAHEIGAGATDPGALRAALAEALMPRPNVGAVRGQARTRAEAAAYLAAVAARSAAGDLPGARAFARRLLLIAPRVVFSWPPIRRAVTRQLLAGSAIGRALLDFAVRARALAARWRGGLWRPPRVVR